MDNRLTDILEELGDDKRDEADLIRLQMSTPLGRRFVFAVLQASGMKQNPLHPDASIMGFNVGKQDIGRWLDSIAQLYCPDKYLLMLKESMEDYNGERSANDPDADGAGLITGSRQAASGPDPDATI